MENHHFSTEKHQLSMNAIACVWLPAEAEEAHAHPAAKRPFPELFREAQRGDGSRKPIITDTLSLNILGKQAMLYM